MPSLVSSPQPLEATLPTNPPTSLLPVVDSAMPSNPSAAPFPPGPPVLKPALTGAPKAAEYIFSIYSVVGTGWCTDSHGRTANSYNRIVPGGMTEMLCRTQCDSDSACVAYNYWFDECKIAAPSRSSAPSGWVFQAGTGAMSITTGLNHGGPKCMRKSQ